MFVSCPVGGSKSDPANKPVSVVRREEAGRFVRRDFPDRQTSKFTDIKISVAIKGE